MAAVDVKVSTITVTSPVRCCKCKQMCRRGEVVTCGVTPTVVVFRHKTCPTARINDQEESLIFRGRSLSDLDR